MDQQRDTSTVTPVAARSHRVHWFSGRLGEVLDDLLGPDGQAGLALAVLGPEQTAETVVEVDRAIARLEGLRGSLLVHAETVEVGAHATPVSTSAGAWFAHATTTPRPAAQRTVKDAQRMEQAYDATGAALRAGSCDAAQARVIVKALDDLPGEVDTELRAEAEAHLLDLARTHDAQELKALAKHLHEVIDPEGAEAALAARLAAEEEAAHAAATLQMWDDGKGRTTGRFDIPTMYGAVLGSVLDAIASPKRPGNQPGDGPGDQSGDQPGVQPGVQPDDQPDDQGIASSAPRSNGWVDDPTAAGRKSPRDQVRGRAFLELLENLRTARLPRSGGSPFAVVVTMTLETLLGGLTPALLDTGHRISPGEARRLAARHGVIPAVLGTKSEVLDLGRKARFHNKAMRTALRIQHRTCTAQGCTIPAAWCHAHHQVPWAAGGPTSLRDGTLLCGRHHRIVHHPAYTVTYDPGGTTHLTRRRT